MVLFDWESMYGMIYLQEYLKSADQWRLSAETHITT